MDEFRSRTFSMKIKNGPVAFSHQKYPKRPGITENVNSSQRSSRFVKKSLHVRPNFSTSVENSVKPEM
jgi:hypothetical protein